MDGEDLPGIVVGKRGRAVAERRADVAVRPRGGQQQPASVVGHRRAAAQGVGDYDRVAARVVGEAGDLLLGCVSVSTWLKSGS